MFKSIKEERALIDLNNEIALYYNERFKRYPMHRRSTRDHTKGGSD